MRILILNWRDLNHPLGGGAERYLFEHAKRWKKKGSDVTWFTSKSKNAQKSEIVEGIEFIRAGSEYTVYIYAFIYYLRGIFGKPDLVIDSFHGIPFFTPLYVLKPKIIALVHEVAGDIWFVNLAMPISYIGFIMEKLSYFFYFAIPFITVSKSTKNDLMKRGIKSKNIHIIFNGLNEFSVKKVKKEKKPTLIFLGRIANDKGVADLLGAFNMVSNMMSHVKLWIVGREEFAGSYKKMSRQYLVGKARKKVRYFGYVSENEKFKLLSKAWVLIHPSMKEGWGLNVIEAASQQTPAIGYNVEGLRDSIVDGKTGLLSDPNPISLANCISDIVKNSEKRIKMSSAAKEWSKNFSWEKSGRKSWKLIKSIVNTN